MAKHTSVTLGEHLDQFINQRLNSGREASASEILPVGLRALQEQETKVLALSNVRQRAQLAFFNIKQWSFYDAFVLFSDKR